MSTDENKAVVRRWFSEVVSNGDMSTLDEICAVCHPAFVMVQGVVEPAPQGISGLKDLVAAPAYGVPGPRGHGRGADRRGGQGRQPADDERDASGRIHGHARHRQTIHGRRRQHLGGSGWPADLRMGQLGLDGHAAATRGDNSRARFLTDLRARYVPDQAGAPGRGTANPTGEVGHQPVTPRWRSVRPRLHTRRHHRRRCRRRSHSYPGRGPRQETRVGTASRNRIGQPPRLTPPPSPAALSWKPERTSPSGW